MRIFLFILLLSSAAYAKDGRYPLPPPWDFDYPYRGRLTITFTFPDTVHKICMEGPHAVKGIPFGNIVRACALPSKDLAWCHITMPHKRFYIPEVWDALLRHELAHCNGWNHE